MQGLLKGTENCKEKSVQIYNVTSIMVSKSELYCATPWLHNFMFLTPTFPSSVQVVEIHRFGQRCQTSRTSQDFSQMHKKKAQMATGPVSWSLTHPTVFWATISPAYLREKHSALLYCLLSLVLMTLYEAAAATFLLKSKATLSHFDSGPKHHVPLEYAWLIKTL